MKLLKTSVFKTKSQRIWSHLLKKFLMENFIFCAVSVLSSVLWDTMNCGTACACCSKVLFLHLALILCTLFSSISADLPYYVFVVLRLMLLAYFPFVLWFYSFWLSTKTCETCVRHCGTSNSKCYFALSEWVSEEKWQVSCKTKIARLAIFIKLEQRIECPIVT